MNHRLHFRLNRRNQAIALIENQARSLWSRSDMAVSSRESVRQHGILRRPQSSPMLFLPTDHWQRGQST
jgi:hypothetical protein